MENLFASDPDGGEKRNELGYKNRELCDSVEKVTTDTGPKKKLNFRRKRRVLARTKYYRKKRGQGIVCVGQLDGNDGVLDMSKSLPFTHCRIVLSLEDDKENAKSGWTKEGDVFVFHDSITSRERNEMAMHLWEPRFPGRQFSKSENSGESDSDICSSSESEVTKLDNCPDSVISEDEMDLNLENVNERENFIHSVDMATKLDKLNKAESDKEKFGTVPAQRIYKCPFCFLPFAEAGALIEHLPIHETGGNETRIGELKDEPTVIHTSGVSLSSSNLTKPYNAKKARAKPRYAFKCRKCDYTGLFREKLEKHMEVHNKNGKPLSCSQCPSYFRHFFTLRMHEKHVHKQRKLQTKGKSHFDKSAVSSNVPSKSIYEKNSGHPEEGRRTLEKNEEIKEYIENVGSKGKRQWRCTLCTKLFIRKEHAVGHVRNVHKKGKEFRCSICPKVFYQNSRFKYHLTTHSNVKPFPCKLCPKSFSYSGGLTSHMLFHNGVKRFRCSLCPTAFLNYLDLRKHIGRIHPGSRSNKK